VVVVVMGFSRIRSTVEVVCDFSYFFSTLFYDLANILSISRNPVLYNSK
jgi:hypothetical protein